jgi:hypothetical protein
VATLAPQRELVRITASGVDRGLSAAWIGDHTAFAKYQEEVAGIDRFPRESTNLRRSILSAAQQDQARRMNPAFVQVINSDEAPTVDGFPICAAPTRSGYRYESLALLASPEDPDQQPTESWGSTEEGRFGFAIKPAREPGVGAVGAYFPHGRYGLFYYPAKLNDCQLYEDVSDTAFAERVKEEFEIELAASMSFTRS